MSDKNSVVRFASRRSAQVIAIGVLLGGVAVTSFADRGRGTIRGAERSAPEPRGGGAQRAPEPRHVEEPQRAPEPQRTPEPRRVEEPRGGDGRGQRDWDEHDEDGRHFGGFAPGVPVHAYRGERIRVLPPHHIDIAFGPHHYFRDDVGIYYEPQPDGQYIVVQPPIGVIVPALPAGVVPIVVGPTTYYYLDGTFYVAQNGAFAVVNPPPGIIVPSLPTGANQVVINGTVLYQFNGFNYQPALENGVTVYTVTPA